MITAVDTNIILDVLVPGTPEADRSEMALVDASRSGALVISEPVYAELSVHFADQEALDRFLLDTRIRLDPTGSKALFRAGKAWKQYVMRRPGGTICPQCGAGQGLVCGNCRAPIRSRQHLIADFMIGAHASVQAGRLLTRDRGYYGAYFPELPLP